MVYKWRVGSHQSGNAQIAGEMCAELEAKGQLTASNLVDVNRPEDAPLHDSFEWDDSIAGEEWRKQQARHIIQAITVVAGPTQEPKRIFYSVETTVPNYDSVQTIIRSEDKYQKLLEMARREMEQFERKYAEILELSAVFDAINEFLATNVA